MTALPPGWRATTLGQLGQYLNGRGFKKSEWRDSGRPIIRIQNLTGSSDVFNYYDGEADERYTARAGGLLVSWAATLGAYIWPGPEAVVNQHIFKVESSINTKFHKYLLDHKLADLGRQTHGSGMVHITRGRFDALPVTVPCEESEQRRIVDILEDHLSRLDAAEASSQTAKVRLAAYHRSSLTSVIDRDCRRRVALGQLVRRIEAGRSFGGASAAATPDEWGIIKVSAMTWGAFRPEENKAVPSAMVDPRFEIRSGDLLVSRANTSAYVGASVLVGEVRPRLLLSDKSLRVIPSDAVISSWLQLALSSPRARAQISAKATGTKESMRNISQEALLAVQVPYIPLTEQAADVAQMSDQKVAIDLLSTSIAHIERRQVVLRRALLAAAFAGRLTGRSSDMDVAERIGQEDAAGLSVLGASLVP